MERLDAVGRALFEHFATSGWRLSFRRDGKQYEWSRRALAPAVTGAIGLLATLDAGSGLALAAPIFAVSSDDGLGLRTQFLWILGSAAVGGGLGYGTATLVAPAATTIALGFGTAVGGGLGAVVRLLVLEDSDAQDPDEAIVSSSPDTARVPDPQPVDLFDENPDPVLYFDDSGGGPVVRAANPAFEATFGVRSDAVENAALADAAMVTDRVDDIGAAIGDSMSFDAVLDCETAGDERPFRVRTIAVARDTGTRGYVLYTALGGS